MTPLTPVNDVAMAAPTVVGLPVSLIGWLQRVGRFHNPHPDTNTLGASDDHAAVAAFLRERATRSRHTWRAYTAELQRLAHWCTACGRGPLSDLTRQDLLAYQASLRCPPSAPADANGTAPSLSELFHVEVLEQEAAFSMMKVGELLRREGHGETGRCVDRFDSSKSRAGTKALISTVARFSAAIWDLDKMAS